MPDHPTHTAIVVADDAHIYGPSFAALFHEGCHYHYGDQRWVDGHDHAHTNPERALDAPLFCGADLDTCQPDHGSAYGGHYDVTDDELITEALALLAGDYCEAEADGYLTDADVAHQHALADRARSIAAQRYAVEALRKAGSPITYDDVDWDEWLQTSRIPLDAPDDGFVPFADARETSGSVASFVRTYTHVTDLTSDEWLVRLADALDDVFAREQNLDVETLALVITESLR